MSRAGSGLLVMRSIRFARLCLTAGLLLSCGRSGRAAPKPDVSNVRTQAPSASASAPAPVASALGQAFDPIAVPDAHGQIGLIDRQGHVIAAPQFEQVMQVSEGLLPARQRGLWGFIDKRGGWAIPARFAVARLFSEDRAAVSLPGAPALGYVDHSGHFAISPRFRSADAFHEGLAHVTLAGTSAYVDKAGAVVFNTPGEWSYGFREGLARFVSHGHHGFVDARGHVVIAARFDEAFEFSEGLAAVKVGKLWGFIDPTGAYRIRPRFVYASFFSCGIAKVALTEAQLSFVDQRGKLLGSFEANADCRNGYAAVMKANLWGFIDATGAVVVEPKFEKFEDGFAEGVAAVAEPNRPFGYIGTDGHYVIEPRFQFASAFENGLARVERSNRDAGPPELGYIDHGGRFVWGPVTVAP
jgi:WG repeat protein